MLKKTLASFETQYLSPTRDDIAKLKELQLQQKDQFIAVLQQLQDETDIGFRELTKLHYQNQTAVLEAIEQNKSDSDGRFTELMEAWRKKQKAVLEAIEQVKRDSDARFTQILDAQRQEHGTVVAAIQELQHQNRLVALEVAEQAKRDNDAYFTQILDAQRQEHSTVVAAIQQNQSAIMSIQQQLSTLFQLQMDLKTLLFTVISYVQNQAIPENELCLSERFHYLQKLHQLLEPKELDSQLNKIRVGRRNDCGYIMVVPLSEQKIAYSIGIATEVSWDRDMASYGYQIYQYDHTIQALPEENESFHWHKIGLGKADKDDIKTLESVMAENGHIKSNGMILKMDIEGAEWDVINACSTDILDAFDQIVLELHDLTVSPQKSAIVSALEKLNSTHFIAHIHGNNYSFVDYCCNLVTPNVLEITCLNRRKYHYTGKLKAVLPLGIDDPNRPDAPDIPLGNW